jgi:hypothetical protein
MNKWISVPVLLILTTTVMSPLQAQGTDGYDQLNDRFRIYLGGFWPDVDSNISINGTVVNPPPIDVENVLGIEEGNEVVWGGARWRISRRNGLEFEYFELDREGVQGFTNESIGVGDFIVESGFINTAFDIAFGRLTYGFSLVRNDRMDLQLKAGLHLADISAALQLSGNVCDTTMGQSPPGCPLLASPVVEAEDVTAPLPHFGGSFAYAFTDTVAFRFQVIGFAIELDSIDGSLVEIDADVAWHPWRHFGVGVGARYFNVDVEAMGSELNGKFDFEYFGPVVYIATTF